MPRIEVRRDESLERALRRFKRLLEREGVLKALKAKKHYEKPSAKKRREIRQSISRRTRAVSEGREGMGSRSASSDSKARSSRRPIRRGGSR